MDKEVPADDMSTVSVVVLNRDRIDEIGRTLISLQHQTLRNFELVIVTNQPNVLRERFELVDRVKIVEFAEQNISKARNAGIEATAGELIAFCDDDAVPEPMWLARLVAPFANPEVGAVGGNVRGRNGVSLQWGAQEVDCYGNDWQIAVQGNEWIRSVTQPERTLKTVGTNCAFRADALVAVGGFDAAYRFFLDETDVNRRLADAGWKTVIVPDAEVHHGYARSVYRNSQRVPRSLIEIGASKAVFCKKYGDPARVPQEIAGFRRDQKVRLLRAFDLGLLPGHRIRPLMVELEEGLISGARRVSDCGLRARHGTDFLKYCQSAVVPRAKLVTARIGSRRKAYEKARTLATTGLAVTLFDFSYTPRMTSVRFTDDGIWLHRGGVFGRTIRSDRLLTIRNFSAKVADEKRRVENQRRFIDAP